MLDLVDRPIPHRVRRHGEGMTLLDYLELTFPKAPPEDLRQGVAEGRFSLKDGPVLGASSRLREGMTLLAEVPAKSDDDPFLPAPTGPLPVLFEDEDLYVIDKPPGLLSYPLGARKIAALSVAERQLEGDGLPVELRPLHRIDRETSGVLAMARTEFADRRIKRAFQKRNVAKSYLALVRGVLPGGVQIVREPIGPDVDGDIRIRMAVRKDGRAAETLLRTISHFGDVDHGPAGRGFTWVEARPRTGRTHQIRVHLAWLGHPLVGDKVYCDGGRAFLRRWEGLLDSADIEELGLPRHALHAWAMVLEHPRSGEDLRLLAPVARDLAAFTALHGGEVPTTLPELEVPRR